jgi:transposase
MDSSCDFVGIDVPKSRASVSHMEESTVKSTTIAVDLAKSVFELAVSHHPGRVASRHRLSRSRFLEWFARQSQATVLLEACGSAHHWARQLQSLGHSVQLLPPRYVRPYVRRSKTDQADATALLEAHRNAEIRPVPVKSVSQQAIAALHRLRSAWMRTRTARINTLRGLLRELGVIIPHGSSEVLPRVGALLDDPDGPIPAMLRPAVAEALEELRCLQARILLVERQLRCVARQTPTVERLMEIQGVGLLTATALVAAVGDIHRFGSCRHFASFLGLTPKEHSSGLKRRLGAISKGGDTYLRTLVVHGGRSVLRAAHLQRHKTPLHLWALDVEARRGHNKAAVALANKLARIIYAVWRTHPERPTTIASA